MCDALYGAHTSLKVRIACMLALSFAMVDSAALGASALRS